MRIRLHGAGFAEAIATAAGVLGAVAEHPTMAETERRVVLLTGGTSGIGREATRRLADAGMTVAVVGRDESRGTAVAETDTEETPGTVGFHRADLSRQDRVRSLAREVRERYDRLDVLAHNAGLSSAERVETVDGLERTFAVNHLAPYLLTHELVGRLRESAPARVVVTASGIHRRGSLDFEDLQSESDYDGLDAYADSKLANVAFTVELAARLGADVTANCFHPGFVPSTGLFRDAKPWTRLAVRAASLAPGVGTDEDTGARRLVRLVTDPRFAQHSGAYLGSDGIEEPDPAATDPAIRERLWTESARLVGVDPDWP